MIQKISKKYFTFIFFTPRLRNLVFTLKCTSQLGLAACHCSICHMWLVAVVLDLWIYSNQNDQYSLQPSSSLVLGLSKLRLPQGGIPNHPALLQPLPTYLFHECFISLSKSQLFHRKQPIGHLYFCPQPAPLEQSSDN